MTQSDIYMEDDNLRLYVDVQPLFIDELENSKNAAASSAAQAALSEQQARSWKNDITDYKTSLELFYAQASDSLSNLYDNSVSELTLAKNNAISNLQTQKNTILNSIASAEQTALSDINTIARNYVNQARSYAEEAQNTLDNRVSSEHLNHSKCWETGQETDDPETVAAVMKYARSTFDSSKFTVVGSPVITEDGVVKYVSTSATDTITAIPPSMYRGVNNWHLRFDEYFSASSDEGTERYMRFCGDVYSQIRYTHSYNSILMELYFSSGSAIMSIESIRSKIQQGKITIDIYYSSTTGYYFTVTQNGTTYTSSVSSNTNEIRGTSNNLLYLRDIVTPFDLKTIAFDVDGVEVFNGNKTGIDTIKPDDYTVEGTPTISADGIASGFSNSNYINTGYTLDTSNTWSIKTNFSTGSSIASDQFILAPSINGYNGVSIQIRSFSENNQVLQVYLPSNSAWLKTFSLNITGQINTNFDVEVKYDGATYYFYANGILIDSLTSSTKIDSTQPFLIGKSGQWGQAWAGSIDLNAFKIYVDGNLVYQPCLKIPYIKTDTIYGSKVISSHYYDRAHDACVQGFPNLYHTFNEKNGKVRLPKGEIYGMIEKLRQLIIERTSE